MLKWLYSQNSQREMKDDVNETRQLMSTSSCSFWVKPLSPFPVEAWPMKVMTLISGAWRFNMAAISCTLSRYDEKIMTRVLTSWGPGPGHSLDRTKNRPIQRSRAKVLKFFNTESDTCLIQMLKSYIIIITYSMSYITTENTVLDMFSLLLLSLKDKEFA